MLSYIHLLQNIYIYNKIYIELLWKAEEDSAKGGNHEVVVQLRRELNVLLDKENRMWSQRFRA